jgi:ABC-2 type transport system permease protein
MKKVWLVASNVYRRQIRSGTFLLLTFLLPLLMVIAGAVPILRETRGELPVVGIVDGSGRLEQLGEVEIEGRRLEVSVYTDEVSARSAVEDGEVAGFLLIPPAYPQGGSPTFHGEKEPRAVLRDALKVYVQRALTVDAPAWKTERLLAPGRVTYVDVTTGQEMQQGPGVVIRVLIPALLAVIFSLVIFTTISQMGAVMVEEKEKRSMEMIVTSVRPRELVSGKVLGMGLVSLTQIAIWAAAALLAAALALSTSLSLDEVILPSRALLWAALLSIPAYFLYVVLAAGLGIIAGGKAQAQQLAGILGFLALAPVWLTGFLVQNPDGPLAVALTLFPLTAPTFALIRIVITEVPIWQLVSGASLILLGLGLSIYGVARIFRAAMLLYGQTLRPRQIWEVVQTSST